MKHSVFDKHWDAIKGELEQRYGQLVDDDLTFIEGKGEELLARLREKLGMSEGELDELLDRLHAEAAGRFERMKERAGEFAQDLKQRAAHAGEEARVQAAAAYDRARRRAVTWRGEGEEYVRQHPRESLVAALCAGFVAGLLIRR